MKKIITLIICVICLYGCKKELVLNYKQNPDINELKLNDDLVNNLEENLRIVIVGDVIGTEMMHFNLIFSSSSENGLIKKQNIFIGRRRGVKAIYFDLGKNIQRQSLELFVWNKKNREGRLKINTVKLLYKHKEFKIPASEFLDYFKLNDFLLFNNKSQLVPINTKGDIFKPLILPTDKFNGLLNDFIGPDNFLEVSLNIKVTKTDDLKLYFLTDSNNAYNERCAISKKVKGRQEFQKLNFLIPIEKGTEFNINNLRFDYGTVKEQVVSINSIELSYLDKELSIKQNEINTYFNSPEKWNLNIDLNAAKYGVKELNGKVDSKLNGNKSLEQALKSFR